jgi:solute carrier family 35 (UDP-galactose transporter), member B1
MLAWATAPALSSPKSLLPIAIMARRKQVTPMQRINSGEVMQAPANQPEQRAVYTNGRPIQSKINASKPSQSQQQSILTLLICVGGIYISFLTWGFLQERITTTPYHITSSTAAQPQLEYFRFPLVLNTIQAFFAFTSASLYLCFTSSGAPDGTKPAFFLTPILPNRAALWPFTLLTLTSTVASPFGYASLAHVDYLTFVLAKSCKLLPVMFLHVTLFRKRYPLQKYVIVLAVTAGVALFTIYHPPKAGKAKAKVQSSSIYGLSLLGINLLLDGLTNTMQDQIFKTPERYGRITGPQMMVVLNFMSTILQAMYLLVTPLIPASLLPSIVSPTSINELSSATSFLSRHPAVLRDVLGFCAAGAIGQIFIYETLARFSSLLLVTVTVTRKMLTMLLSVVWFGHRLGGGQWAGVLLVFGGVAGEAWLGQREKREKERRRKIEVNGGSLKDR